jgi:PAS domain S-box-containing protein
MDLPRKILKTNHRRFVKSYRLLGVILAILACFVAYLLVRLYGASSLMAETSRRSFALENKTRVSILAEYLEHRITDLETLSNSRALRAYYQNKALGMSLEYGLAVAQAEVRDEFEWFQKTVLAKNRPVFLHITFLDRVEMRVLAETAAPTDTNPIEITRIEKILQNLDETPVFRVVEADSKWAAFVVKSFKYKDKVRGYLLMRLDLITLLAQIHADAPADTDEFEGISESGGILIAGPSEFIGKKLSQLFEVVPQCLYEFTLVETRSQTSKIVGDPMIVFSGRVINTPFCFVSASPISKCLAGYSPFLWKMAFAGLIAGLAIMMFLIYKSFSDQSRMYYQLQEAHDTLENRVRDRTAELAEINRQLQIEVNERKRTDYALQESEKKYRELVENANESIIVIQDGNFQFVNVSASKLFDCSVQELTSKSFADFVHPDDRVIANTFFTETADRDNVNHSEELRIAAASGTMKWVDFNSVLIQWQGKQAILVFLTDITGKKITEEEKRKLRHQLLQAQKMEAVGTLAGGVAHDFNNLLQVILGYSQFLQVNKEPDSTEYGRLQKIISAAQRGSDLVKGLLTLSRKAATNPRPLNINEHVIEVSSLLERTIPKMIQVELNLEGSLPTIYADPAQIEQVLMNLGLNAKDAMPEDGRLIIETKTVFLDQEFCSDHVGAKPGRHVMLAVTDTGHGMDGDVLAHIFEPFFTTKEVGKGSGLGLAMVYGIVKQHDGYISCESLPNRGTTFRIYFPEAKGILDEPDHVIDSVILGGSETILLVDDEELVRNLVSDYLSEAGYTVLTACHGKEALDVYQKNVDDVSIIILDLNMPQMGGKDCFRELLKINPDVKVLVASGYAMGGAESATISGTRGFVEKPYDMRILLETIRKVLDEG